jgi:hypothetical protein
LSGFEFAAFKSADTQEPNIGGGLTTAKSRATIAE